MLLILEGQCASFWTSTWEPKEYIHPTWEMEEKRAGKFVGMRDLGREETETSSERIKRCYNRWIVVTNCGLIPISFYNNCFLLHIYLIYNCLLLVHVASCYTYMRCYCGGWNLERNSYICSELYHCVFVKELWWVNYEIGMEIGLKIVVFVYSWL